MTLARRSSMSGFLILVVLLAGALPSAAAQHPVARVAAAVRTDLAPLAAEELPPMRVTAPRGALRTLMLERPAPLAVSGGSEARALAVARALAPLWGGRATLAEQLVVERARTLGDGAMVHVELRRWIDGIGVAGPPVRVALTTAGDLVAVTGTPEPAPVAARLDRLGPVDAVRVAALKLEQRSPTGEPAVLESPAAPGEPFRLRWGSARRQLAAWQRFVAEDDGLHLGWEVLYTAADGRMWMAQVDGGTGRLVRREPLTFTAGPPHGLAFTQGSPQPLPHPGTPPASGKAPEVSRVDTSFAGDPVASPHGWVGSALKSEGNNVIAREDHDDDDGLTTPGEGATAPNGDFSFPLQLGAGAPPITDFVPAVVTNLFYWTNWAHDALYALGFDEAAGNFQADNLDRGGVGGDPLRAFAQQGATLDSPIRDNAYMSTPPDGFAPEMGMFIWGPYSGWYTDSALDADIIVHEYTHGATARLGSAWYDLQSGAMNEGNSDFMALNLLLPAGIDPGGSYPVATYASQDFQHGIRTRPYSSDAGINSLTYGDFGHVVGLPEVHADGEIWVEAMWECRARLVARHGDAQGRERAGRLLLDMLLLAPPNPSMLEARDAFLLAERVRYGGEDQDALWQAFAARGMGAGAFGGDGSTLTVEESFADPSEVAPHIIKLVSTIAEGTIEQVWVADGAPAAAPVLTVSTSAGDHESLPLAADGHLLTTELITVRGPAVPDDGVVQAPADTLVTLGYPGASDATLGVRAVHSVQLDAPGLESIADEVDLGLHSDDDTVTYQLPFTSGFAGFGGKSLTVSTNGVLSAYPLSNDYLNSATGLADTLAIAPLWFDLRTDGEVLPGEGVYVATGEDWVRFHWVAETVEVDESYVYVDGAPVDVACTLFADGRVVFEYGPGNTGFSGILGRQPSPTVGLGYNGVALLVPGYDQAADLGEAHAVVLRPPGGLTSEQGRLALWAGDEAELAFVLPDGHAGVDVTAAVADDGVAAIAGPATATVPQGQDRAALRLTGVTPGRTTVTLTASDGSGATVPVEVFGLGPDPVAGGQLVVLAGPFDAADPAAEVTLQVAGGSPRQLVFAGGAAGRQAFGLPVGVAPGSQHVTVRWNGRSLPERTLTVIGSPTTLDVSGLAPISPAPGQRLRVLAAGTPDTPASLSASFSGAAGTVELPVRAVLGDGSVLLDVPEDVPSGAGTLVLVLDGATASVPLTVAGTPALPVSVSPAAGERVAPGARVVVTGDGGGGLALAANTLRVAAGGLSWELAPVADDGGAVAYRLPNGLPAGQVTLTPAAVLAGQSVTAAGVTVTSGGADAPSASALRGAELGVGELELAIATVVAPGEPGDLQLRLASGPRVRLLDATRLGIDGRTATFNLPADLPGGVLELRLRMRTGASWGPWGEPAGAVLEGPLVVAAAASAGGVGGSLWRTDLAILNPTDEAAEVALSYGGAHRTATVPARGQLSQADVVGGLFSTSGSGALKIAGPGELLAVSRTYNLGAAGTFGQLLAGERSTGALVTGEQYELVGLAESAAFRSNLGLVNAGSGPAVVRVRLYDGEGVLLETRDQSLAAGKRLQVNGIFADWAGQSALASGRIGLELLSGTRVHAYASVVDNGTGDPTTVPPLAVAGSGPVSLWVAAAAASGGLNGTVWRTDLVVANPGAAPASVTVSLVDGMAAAPLHLELAAGESRRVADVVGAGGFKVSGSGALRIAADRPVLATARVYNQAPAGTFGQLLVAEPSSAGLRAEEVGWLPMLAGPDGFRTNVGLFNPGDTAQKVRVELFADDGSPAGRVERTLAPGRRVQVGEVVGVPHAWGRVTLEDGAGPVLVYASVVDNATGDPTTVPLVR